MPSLRLTFPSEPGTPPLVTTVLNAEAHLVTRTTLSPRNRSELLELAPGDYLVQVERPSGPPLQRTARLEAGKTAEPNLGPDFPSPHEWLRRGQVRGILGYGAAFRLPTLPSSPRPETDVRLRLWTRTGPAWTPVPPSALHATTAPDAARVDFRTGANPAHALQLAGPDLPSRIIILPGFETGMALVLTRKEDADLPAEVTFTIDSDDDLLDSLAQTLAASAPTHPADIWEHAADGGGVLAERALYEKMQDPARAALGGYYLLRFGMLDHLHDWPENLANWFPMLADGPVIRAWQHLRDEHHHDVDKATSRLIEAAERGIPVFAEGLRLLVDGLRLVIRARPDRQDALKALERVGPHLAAAAPVGAHTAFFGTAPDQPTTEPEGPASDAAMPADGATLTVRL